MIAGFDAGYARADLPNHARTFVAEDRWEQAFAIEAVERVSIGMADTGRHDLNEDFAVLGSFKIHFDDLERLLGRERDGGAGLHESSPAVSAPCLFCRKRRIQPATRALSFGASSEPIAASGSGTMS